jgi:hypothetical protein
MKIPALLTALLLAGGVAFAQTDSTTAAQPQSGTTSDASIAKGNRVDGTMAKPRAGTMGSNAAASTDMSKNDTTMADNTRSGAQKMADATHHGARKTRHAMKKGMHKAKDKVAMDDMHHRHHDARAMGAGASPMTDVDASSRKSRMDAAYDDWKSKQK